MIRVEITATEQMSCDREAILKKLKEARIPIKSYTGEVERGVLLQSAETFSGNLVYYWRDDAVGQQEATPSPEEPIRA